MDEGSCIAFDFDFYKQNYGTYADKEGQKILVCSHLQIQKEHSRVTAQGNERNPYNQSEKRASAVLTMSVFLVKEHS